MLETRHSTSQITTTALVMETALGAVLEKDAIAWKSVEIALQDVIYMSNVRVTSLNTTASLLVARAQETVRVGRGAKGASGMGGGCAATERDNPQRKRVLEVSRILRGCVRHLPKLCTEYLARNNIKRHYAENAGILWNEAKGQFVIPLPTNGVSSEVLVRDIRTTTTGGTKWLNLVGEGAIYPCEEGGDVVYLVEAPTSALAIASTLGFTSIATLGTNLSAERVRAIKEIVKDRKVIFCPDIDVTKEKARSIKKMLTLSGMRCIVKRVKTKPRYCLDEFKLE